jgi:hypothetical protein
MRSTVSRDVVKCLDTRRAMVMAQRRQKSIRVTDEQGEGGTAASRNSLLTGLIHGGGSLSAIRSTRARIETAAARIAAEGVIGGEDSRAGDMIHLVTVPWESSVKYT